MGALWDLVQAYKDAQDWPVPDAQIARRLGLARSAPARWKTMSDLPTVETMRGIARICGYPYLRVLNAALLDCGYVQPGEIEGSWAVSAADVIDIVEADDRVRAVLDGPGSGADRAAVLADLLRRRIAPTG
ncbi:hypothetical protein [Arsenicicoccus dermatophilus]|uniref:hypothetical protein n=1 Tax=Arsenicicoccus dermatophilus TaxID=1076331 RepID=UPI001F4CDCA1|nr:hypothetical protein [Arsenicicoccus dermatophilus]MCH8613427.1 hypothetical protein [Arsenicicoccus dermatophilus]